MKFWHTLSDHEKRTIRFAGLGVGVYLALFGGFEVWKHIDQRRADYLQLAQEADDLRQQTLPYKEKAMVLQKLMDQFHLDPARLKRATAVSDASAAIQKSAKDGGLALGPIRETQAHGAGAALAAVQMDGSGQASAVLSFLAGLNTIGFPLVVDSVQFTSENNRPGMVKITLTILILDFDRQKQATEAPHA